MVSVRPQRVRVFRRVGLAGVLFIAAIPTSVVATATTEQRPSGAVMAAVAHQRTRSEIAVPGVEDLSYEVLESSPGWLHLVAIDRSGRNMTVKKALASTPEPTIRERRFPVQIAFPTTDDGLPLSGPTPMLVGGGYRRGMDSGGPPRDPNRRPNDIEVYIGFFKADYETGVDVRDLLNMPGDVSRGLDVVFAVQDRIGTIDPGKVLYQGSSLPGITGFLFVHPLLREPRITAMRLHAATQIFWIPAFRRERIWRQAPPILMENGTADEVIPYNLARRTFKLARSSKQVTLLTTVGADHEGGVDGIDCPPRVAYSRAWVESRWKGEGTLSASLRRAVQKSTCSRIGLVKGGSQGFGSLDPFVPPDAR